MTDVNDVNPLLPIRPLPIGPGIGEKKRRAPLPNRKNPDEKHGDERDDTEGGGIDEYA